MDAHEARKVAKRAAEKKHQRDLDAVLSKIDNFANQGKFKLQIGVFDVNSKEPVKNILIDKGYIVHLCEGKLFIEW